MFCAETDRELLKGLVSPRNNIMHTCKIQSEEHERTDGHSLKTVAWDGGVMHSNTVTDHQQQSATVGQAEGRRNGVGPLCSMMDEDTLVEGLKMVDEVFEKSKEEVFFVVDDHGERKRRKIKGLELEDTKAQWEGLVEEVRLKRHVVRVEECCHGDGNVGGNMEEIAMVLSQAAAREEDAHSGVVTMKRILPFQVRRDSFLRQLGLSLRTGYLSKGPATIRGKVLTMLDSIWRMIFSGVDSNRVRMVYETVRDCIGSVKRDAPPVLVELNAAALVSLTRMMCQVNMPQRDPRMVKFHVERLYNLMNGDLTLQPANYHPDSKVSKLLFKGNQVAAKCLGMLEDAFPMLLSLHGAQIFAEAKRTELRDGNPSFPKTILALQVLSHIAEEYSRQQERDLDVMSQHCCHEGEEASSNDFSDMGAEDILAVTSAGSFAQDGSVDGEEVLQTIGPMSQRSKTVDPRRSVQVQDFKGNFVLKSGSSMGITVGSDEYNSSPTGMWSNAYGRSSVSSGTPKQDGSTASISNPDLILRIGTLRSEERQVDNALSSRMSTPRDAVTLATRDGTRDVLIDHPPGKFRFIPPERYRMEESKKGSEIILSMTPFAEKTFQDAVLFALTCIKRMEAKMIDRASPYLRSILKISVLSPSEFWPMMDSLVKLEKTNVLEFVLELHDALPGLFQGRSPCLMEKILCQSNDDLLDLRHRQTCLRWIIRQHAIRCHENNGSELLLGDCWSQLLPRDQDPLEITSMKVKALSSCLSSGIGDASTICDAVCLWKGYVARTRSTKVSMKQHRAFSYALRLLNAAAERSSVNGISSLCLQLSLIRSMLAALSLHPELVQPIDEFLDVCNEDFTLLFLKAMEALFSSLDGQFEILRDRQEDVAFDESSSDLSARIKAAVLSRASSLSGMVRGLSFKLGRSNSSTYNSYNNILYRSSSLPGQVDIKGIRASVSAAFGRDTSVRSNHNGDREADITSLVAETDFCSDVSLEELPQVPAELQERDDAERWLGLSTTWSSLVPAMLKHDLMAFRTLLQRIVRSPGIQPTGTLRSVANYSWQYKSFHPSHSLNTRDTGAACLALAQIAALAHLPLPNADATRTLRQHEIAESIMAVLDALQEGFPCASISKRSAILVKLLADENAWHCDRTAATLATLLGGYLDAALEIC